ncbi:hypothetical protein PC118_g7836 [Phytophthora cactorum]|uniref:ZSWIM1/3 RNaseH-like domain-containing protein n=1 Tax=Phytophthora cactorum TaxID=29920 RepID=A0A8T1G1B7_9STRA|nr:hypothetical protein PC118_g7836 [Phytophthora cactorum]
MLRPRTRERLPPTQAAVDNGGDEGDKNSLGDDLDADGEKDEGEDEEKDGEDPGAGADDSSETGEASVDDSTFVSSRAHWQDHNSPRRPQPCPKHKKSRLTDAKRARTVLEEFCDQNGGNSAELVICGERNVASVVTFQTAKMKRLFEAFPEVIMVDSTYNTNTNRYKLLSFVVYDVFGKGQYVHHALVESDEMVNLRQSLEVFKDNNPGWKNVRVVMTAKAVHEKDVLRDMLPHARQLLCQLHVITGRTLRRTCEEGRESSCLPTRIREECGGTSVADLELASLPLQISKFAFNLVSGQHELATGPNANYDVDLDNPGKAAMTAPTTGNVYRVGTLCNCISIQTCLLPYHPRERLADGDVQACGLRLLSGRALPMEPAVFSAAKYQEMKALAAKIMAVMTLQSTPTYHVARYGYATFDQLVGMNRIQEARHRQTLVMRTVKWIDEVEWRIQDLRKPFEDSPSCRQVGIQKLRRGNQPWNEPLSLLALRDEYPGLGVISPSFHDVCLLEQKRRTAGGLGAGNPEYARVIGAMNVGAHWVVFFINRKNKVCKTFDPLQSNVNYKTVEKRVRSVMEPILDLKDQVHFERIEWCTQQD